MGSTSGGLERRGSGMWSRASLVASNGGVGPARCGLVQCTAELCSARSCGTVAEGNEFGQVPRRRAQGAERVKGERRMRWLQSWHQRPRKSLQCKAPSFENKLCKPSSLCQDTKPRGLGQKPIPGASPRMLCHRPGPKGQAE